MVSALDHKVLGLNPRGGTLLMTLQGFQVFKQTLLFLLFPTFPTIFCARTFRYFFSENALLSLLFLFEVTKIVIFSLLAHSCKNHINLICGATMQKFIKYFYFSCNSFFYPTTH